MVSLAKRKRDKNDEEEGSEESEWGSADGASDEGDEQEEEDVGDTGDDSEASDNQAKKPAQRKKKKRPLEERIDESDERDFLPSHARMTDKGGYTHTNTSRLKISRANRGNTPWNKGRIRSEDDKAKISAGVRARNRGILLEKLKRLGMTEEKWLMKKKEIKHVRERLRRAKRANEHRKAADAEKKLKEVIDSTIEKVGAVVASSEPPSQQPVIETKEKVEAAEGALEDGEELSVQPGILSLFVKDIEWTPHSFDAKGASYTSRCPEGGPGGLICCATCTGQYSDFISATTNDIEHQKAAKLGGEITELLGFLSSGKTRLGKSVRIARRKPPPMRRKGDPLPITAQVDPSAQDPPPASSRPRTKPTPSPRLKPAPTPQPKPAPSSPPKPAPSPIAHQEDPTAVAENVTAV